MKGFDFSMVGPGKGDGSDGKPKNVTPVNGPVGHFDPVPAASHGLHAVPPAADDPDPGNAGAADGATDDSLPGADSYIGYTGADGKRRVAPRVAVAPSMMSRMFILGDGNPAVRFYEDQVPGGGVMYHCEFVVQRKAPLSGDVLQPPGLKFGIHPVPLAECTTAEEAAAVIADIYRRAEKFIGDELVRLWTIGRKKIEFSLPSDLMVIPMDMGTDIRALPMILMQAQQQAAARGAGPVGTTRMDAHNRSNHNGHHRKPPKEH